MDKHYSPEKFEGKIYTRWEKSGGFSPSKQPSAKPFTILMPPPNANASLHAGHAMYTIEDILIRWRRMQGYAALWLPGMDHAGFETQFVYEKHLRKQGKSRMDFDRETLYKNVFSFVEENSGLIYEQFKRLGFSADWSRSVFMLDEGVLDRVLATFTKMEKEGLVYRDVYIVQYCTHCGTSLAELEVLHVERIDPLYYVRYPLVEADSYLVVATTRPEPIFADTHIAVHPNDPANAQWVGARVQNPLTGKPMEVIADEFVEPEFGTGVVKLTPGHDANDFAVAKRHGLPIVTAISMAGKITKEGGKYAGMSVKRAREAVVADLEAKGFMEKIDTTYEHSVATCYKCKRDLEPMVLPNWFIKVEDLKKPVIKAVQENRVQFYPRRFKRAMLQWLTIMHDWPISRQIAWGIRIPAWYDVKRNPMIKVTFLTDSGEKVSGVVGELLQTYSVADIEAGLQDLVAPKEAVYTLASKKPGKHFLQETDTFDTWFSSGQWPLVTLSPDEFSTRFPTDVMGTLADILKFWVSRMIMFSLYLKDEVPFRDVYLWSMVADKQGQKMSKSKGNVINPIELVDTYGADALRMALVFGSAAGSKVSLSDDKVRGMRNFANKIWNAARFVMFQLDQSAAKQPRKKPRLTLTAKQKSIVHAYPFLRPDSPTLLADGKFLHTRDALIHKVTAQLEAYQLGLAAETVYEAFWHWFCDECIEKAKHNELSNEALFHGLLVFLKLLHPFMPFVTEAVWGEIAELRLKPDELLMNSAWPTT